MAYSDINEDDIGALTFDIRKSRAVEKITAKIRHHLGADWHRLRDDEIILLENILADCWSASNFNDWEHLNIAAVTFDRIDQLITLARQMKRGRLSGQKAVTKALNILRDL